MKNIPYISYYKRQISSETGWQRTPCENWKTKMNLMKQKIAFWATLCGLTGYVRTPSIARCKTRGRLTIYHDWTFSLSLTAICRSQRVSKRGRSLRAQISDGRGRRPPITVGVRKLKWLPFRAVSKYPQCIVWFRHKARVWQPDRQTDGRTELIRLSRPR